MPWEPEPEAVRLRSRLNYYYIQGITPEAVSEACKSVVEVWRCGAGLTSGVNKEQVGCW